MKKFFRLTMPYCIQRESNGKYVLLNRDYKPIGFNTTKGINYGEYPISHTLKNLTTEIAAKISHSGDKNISSIYLYGDGSVPTDSAENMKKYIKRWKILMQLFV